MGKSQIQIAKSQFDCIDVSDLNELKSLNCPPKTVADIMDLILMILGLEQSWPAAKKLLSNPHAFCTKLKSFDHDSITPDLYSKLIKATSAENFKIQVIKAVSAAACGLFVWINSLLNYYAVAKTTILLK